MKMFKRSLALMFAVLLCCMTVFAVSATGEDNDVVDDWDGAPEEEEILVGDFDKNGKVNARDVLFMRRYAAEIITEEEAIESYDLVAADVDKNGKVNARDILFLRRYLAEILTPEQIEEFGFLPYEE